MLSTGDRLLKLIKFAFVLLVIAVIVVAVTPLNLYYSYVSDYLRPVTLSGISGSAVKGEAEKLTYLSAPIGKSEWLLYPNSINGLGGKFRVTKENYDLTFEIGSLQQDEADFKKILGYIDWKLIKPFLQMNNGQIDGYAQFNLERVNYSKQNGIEHLEGSITLEDFKLIKPTVKDLGQIRVDFETKKLGMVVGQFKSESTVLNVSGTIVIQPHRWQLHLDLIPKSGHFELDAILNSVGDRRNGGGRKLNLAGFY